MNTIEAFRELVRKAIEEDGMNLHQISTQSGAEGSSLSNWYNYKQKSLNFDTVAKVMDFLGVELKTIQRTREHAPIEIIEGQTVPLDVFEMAGAGPSWYSDGLIQSWSSDTIEPLVKIHIPIAYFNLAEFALLVDGESMYPTIKNNAVVGINTSLKFQPDEIYAVNTGDGLAIKRVAINHTNKSYIIRSDNHDKNKYPDREIPITEDEKIIVGRVVWVWQNV